MTIEAQLRMLGEASLAEQRPVTADEVFDRVVGREDATAGRRGWVLAAATLTLVIGGFVTLLALRDTPEHVPTPVVTIPNAGPRAPSPLRRLRTRFPPRQFRRDDDDDDRSASSTRLRHLETRSESLPMQSSSVTVSSGAARRVQSSSARSPVSQTSTASTAAPTCSPAAVHRGVEPRYVNTELAVLAAFDSTGSELWRIELDGRPADMVAAAGAVWVVPRERKR